MIQVEEHEINFWSNKSFVYMINVCVGVAASARVVCGGLAQW